MTRVRVLLGDGTRLEYRGVGEAVTALRGLPVAQITLVPVSWHEPEVTVEVGEDQDWVLTEDSIGLVPRRGHRTRRPVFARVRNQGITLTSRR